jgi:MoaA/NifB/PqqE/SkfB family radical SAM enzyme
MPIAKLHLHVTNQCTSYCKHCSSGSEPDARQVLTRSDFHYILDWAYNEGARWVEFSGGEPLTLGTDLFEIIEYAHSKPFYISILSNGCLLDEQTAQTFRAMGVDRVSISIYGATAGTHDDFTQTPHSFSKTVNGINNIVNVGIESVVNVIVTPQNLDELHHLPSLLDGIDLYTFGSIVPVGRGASLPQYFFSEAGYMNAITTIDRDFTGLNHYFMISLYPYSSQELTRFCMRPVDEVTINHEGHLIPCCVLPDDLRHREGNIHNRDLADVLCDDPIFHWLKQGHRYLRDYLHYSSVSQNLCTSCINMCRLLTSRTCPPKIKGD